MFARYIDKPPFGHDALLPVTKERLSPQAFVSLINTQRGSVKRARFVPPKLGETGFGHVEVTYRHPRLKRGG